MDFRKEMNAVVKAIKKDPDYRAAWVANLTMATYDELTNAMPDMSFEAKKEVANRSAERFLEWMCAGEDATVIAIRHLREVLKPLVVGHQRHDGDCHCSKCVAAHALSCTSGFDDMPEKEQSK